MLAVGDLFGEMSLISHEVRAKATVRCASFMEGFLLSREGYQKLCAIYPAFEAHIAAMAARRLGQSRRHAAFDGKLSERQAGRRLSSAGGSGSTRGLPSVCVSLSDAVSAEVAALATRRSRRSRLSFLRGSGSSDARSSLSAAPANLYELTTEAEARLARKMVNKRTVYAIQPAEQRRSSGPPSCRRGSSPSSLTSSGGLSQVVGAGVWRQATLSSLPQSVQQTSSSSGRAADHV
jgi:CRP-like cAMP-binding protein